MPTPTPTPTPSPTPAPTPTPTPPPVGGEPSDPPNRLAESLTAAMPPVLLGGAKLKAKAAVQLVNRSFRAVSGPAVLRLYASTDESIDPNDAPVGELRTKLKMAPGARKKLSVKLATMSAVPDGTYRLLAQLTRPDGGADVVAAADAFTVAPPTIVLRPAAGRFPARPGAATATAELTIENTGNMPARGLASVLLRANVADGPVLADVPVRLNLAPGKSATVRVRVAVPESLRGTTFTVTARLTAGSITGAVVPLDGASVALTSS